MGWATAVKLVSRLESETHYPVKYFFPFTTKRKQNLLDNLLNRADETENFRTEIEM